jgi:transcriptional regulator with XRE-family HTH domain
MKKLSDRIRTIREKSELTQSEIAEKCVISASAFGQIERNPCNSSYNTLLKVANAMNVSLLYLLDIESIEKFG